jgi:hypothetical protein
MGMNNTPLPHITPLPLLIESSEQLRLDGMAHLFDSQSTHITGVHMVSSKEAFSVLDRWKLSRPDVWKMVSGIALIQLAQKERDWSAFQNGLDLVKPAVPRISDSSLEGRRNSKSWQVAAWLYSGLMSNLLQMARFVFWFPDKADGVPMPGLYCPNWEVALYANVGMGNVRFCKKPGCGVPFIPRFFSPGKDNEQKYCKPAHANAHRVALSKARKKVAEKGRK